MSSSVQINYITLLDKVSLGSGHKLWVLNSPGKLLPFLAFATTTTTHTMSVDTSGRTFLVPIAPFEGGSLCTNLLSFEAQPHKVLIIDLLVDCSRSIQDLLFTSLRPCTSLVLP